MPTTTSACTRTPPRRSPPSRPRCAGFTQALTITQLGNRNHRGAQKLGTGVTSHAFGSTNDSVSVVWSPKGTKTATLKTTKFGRPREVRRNEEDTQAEEGLVKFSVTKNPVFLRIGNAAAGVTR